MTKPVIEEVKQKLEAEKKEIEQQIENLTKENNGSEDSHGAVFPDYGWKEDENAAEVATFADNLSIETDLRNNLARIEKALQKIEQGTFGICEKCQQPIESERLKVSPSATRCVKCAGR